MNNVLSYCGLVDARISASEKDLPVLILNRLAKQRHTIDINDIIVSICISIFIKSFVVLVTTIFGAQFFF